MVARQRQDKRMSQLLELAATAKIQIERVDSSQLDRASEGVRHQGVIAVVAREKQKGDAVLTAFIESLDAEDKAPFFLILDQIQDPHNLGACLRTAEGAGVDAVVLPRDGAVPVNDTVRRVAAGAADRMPVFYVTNLGRVLEKLKNMGLWTTGTANEANCSLYQLDFTGPAAIVMGAEGKGLRRLTRQHCDQLVSIPMAGDVSSLNVSVATGIILYEVVRQRSDPARCPGE